MACLAIAVSVASTLLCSIVAAAAASDNLPRPQRVSLKPVQYQKLPSDVWNVYCGPDGRLWYSFRGLQDGGHATPDKVKRVIEREFEADAPHIRACRILFFEKGRRVWFSPFCEQRLALGYDGRTWIERRSESRFMGEVPNHGKYGRGSQNVSVDGKIFFAHPFGIDWFDGKEWRYKRLFKGKMFDHMQFLPSADRKGFLVLCVGSRTALWRFRGGKWTSINVPGGPDGSGTQYPTMAGVYGDSGVCVTGYSRLPVLIMYEEIPRLPPKEFPALLEKLGAERYSDRKDAVRRLVRLGPSVRPHLERALKNELDDPEVRFRIKEALASFIVEKKGSSVMGPYEVKRAQGIYSDHHGRMIVTTNSVLHDGRELGYGSVMRTALGEFKFLPARKFPPIFPNSTNLTHAGWIEIEGGRRIWFSGAPRYPPCLLDMDTMTVLHQIPDEQLLDLVAVGPDGRVFVRQTRKEGGRWIRQVNPIVVYTPAIRQFSTADKLDGGDAK